MAHWGSFFFYFNPYDKLISSFIYNSNLQWKIIDWVALLAIQVKEEIIEKNDKMMEFSNTQIYNKNDGLTSFPVNKIKEYKR